MTEVNDTWVRSYKKKTIALEDLAVKTSLCHSYLVFLKMRDLIQTVSKSVDI